MVVCLPVVSLLSVCLRVVRLSACCPFVFLLSVCLPHVSVCGSSKWEPDPSNPFLPPPKHLREKIDEFELNEAPSIGLAPRPIGTGSTLNTPTPTKGPKILGTKSEDEDLDFFVS